MSDSTPRRKSQIPKEVYETSVPIHSGPDYDELFEGTSSVPSLRKPSHLQPKNCLPAIQEIATNVSWVQPVLNNLWNLNVTTRKSVEALLAIKRDELVRCELQESGPNNLMATIKEQIGDLETLRANLELVHPELDIILSAQRTRTKQSVTEDQGGILLISIFLIGGLLF